MASPGKARNTNEATRVLPYALLCLNFVGLVLASGTEVLTPSVLTESGSIRHLDFPISAIYLLLNWFMAVKVVDILYEYSRGSLTSSRVASWLRACFLSIIYLQYEINRLPGPVQGMRSDEEIAERTCS
jgi:hypothetical protein